MRRPQRAPAPGRQWWNRKVKTRWSSYSAMDTLVSVRFWNSTRVDDFTRELAAAGARTWISTRRVAWAPIVSPKVRRYPGRWSATMAPSSTSNAMSWQQKRGVEWTYICMRNPMQNGFVESFNGRLRDECSNQHCRPTQGGVSHHRRMEGSTTTPTDSHTSRKGLMPTESTRPIRGTTGTGLLLMNEGSWGSCSRPSPIRSPRVSLPDDVTALQVCRSSWIGPHFAPDFRAIQKIDTAHVMFRPL